MPSGSVALPREAVRGSGTSRPIAQFLRPAVQESTISHPAWLVPLGLAALAGIAFALRAANANQPFASSDNAQLPFHVAHDWGWYWCFQTNYGPLQPAMTKLFALLATGLGGAMTEQLWRMPLALAGSLLPVVTFSIARRLTDRPSSHWLAAACMAMFPPLVSDARYMWGYESLGVVCAAISMLALYRYLESPTFWRAIAFGVSIALYLWSHLLVYALPAVLILASLVRLREMHGASWRAAIRIWVRPAVLIPPLLAVAVTFAMFLRFGGGPIGRTIYKGDIPTTGFRGFGPVCEVLRLWAGHFGYLPFAAAFAVFMGVAGKAIRLRRPTSPLWWWVVLFAGAFLAPFFFKALPPGRYSPYLMQASYVLILLTAIELPSWLAKLLGKASSVSLCIALPAWLLIGSVDATFNRAGLSSFTGVTTIWGGVGDNPGYKSLGWYLQTQTKRDQVVCTLHDFAGLELVPAGYYAGRQCLAFCDFSPAQSLAFFESFQPQVDILVVERRLGITPNTIGEFDRVATIHDGGRELIDIYARASLHLPQIRMDVAEYDERFDDECAVAVIGSPLYWPNRLPPYRVMAARAATIIKDRPV